MTTPNLGLTKPARGDSSWHTPLNGNFDIIDTEVGSLRSIIGDMPDKYVFTDTFNSTTGRTITLPKTVDAITEYAVKIEAIERTTAIGDIWVEKTTTNFVVKCSGGNAVDDFQAIVEYIGDVSQYGGSIYRRWYPSVDAAITDHGNAATVGSLAWILAQIAANQALVELPGNKTYQLKQDLTVAANIQLAFQKGAIIDTDFSIRETTYDWYLSTGGGTTVYYLQASGGGNPSVNTPSTIIENGTRMTEGSLPTLAAGEWDIGDVDGLGYSTIYVRLSDSTDPDTKGAGYLEAGYTFEIHSPANISAADNQQIFSATAGCILFGAHGGGTRIYPTWWQKNTVPGTTDFAAAIQSAIAAIVPAAVGHTATIVRYSRPRIHFPYGSYYISESVSTDTASALNYMIFSGENSIISAAAGVKMFRGIGSNVTFEKLFFHDGAVALKWDTNNLNLVTGKVEGCEFLNQTTAAIEFETDAHSTFVSIKESNFINGLSANAYVIYNPSGASVFLQNCWVDAYNKTNGAFYNAGILKFDNMFGVPQGGPANRLIAWVDNIGTNNAGLFWCYNSRFGGEGGGSTYVVRNYASGDFTGGDTTGVSTIIRDSGIYIQSSPVIFYGLPNLFIFKGNTGLPATQPLWIVDSTVPALDLLSVGNYRCIFIVEDNSMDIAGAIDGSVANGAGEEAVQGIPATEQKYKIVTTTPPSIAEIILTTPGNTGAFGPSLSGTATPTTGTIDGLNSRIVTATADGQYYGISYTTILAGVAAGVYTASLVVEVTTADAIVFSISASNRIGVNYTLTKGRHVINQPFYHDNGATDTIRLFTSNLPDAASYRYMRIIVSTGVRQLNNHTLLIQDAAAPGAGTWTLGDYVKDISPVAGTPKGWICTVAGAPGTWVADANW